MNLDINRNNFGFDLSEFRIIWVGEIPFFAPKYLSILQEKYLIASQLTLLLRNVSVDNILKNWMDDFEDDRQNNKPDKEFILLNDILNCAREQNIFLLKRLNSINFQPETTSSIACDTVFSRLQTTIKSIHFHINFGYYYESFALIRLLLEQLAYAYTASMVSTGEIKGFLSPTESIKPLKKLLPNSGKIYGILSKYSHLDKSTINKYIVFKDEKVFTVHHSIYFSLEACLFYLHLLEYQNIVFEYSFRNYLKEFLFIKKDNNSYVIKNNFKFKLVNEKLTKRIYAILDNKKKDITFT